jgi:hypothetical protein
MTELDIPFNDEMRRLLVLGKKTATARSKRYGSPGDTFRVFSADIIESSLDNYPKGRVEFKGEYVWCILIDVNQYKLSQIAHDFYKAEGFKSSADFIDYWIDLKGSYNPETVKWEHQFNVLGAST